jgi:nucleoside-diphosphate-sugar epimerase
LITGGTGLLGRHLVPALQGQGDNVQMLALTGEDTSWLEARGVAIHRGDVRQPDSLVAPLRGVDSVLHMAAMMGLWRPISEYRAVNVIGTENVCRAALAEGAGRLVHVSSWTVYGMDLGEPAREDFPLEPFRDPYSISKTEADLLVQKMVAKDRLPAVIVRPGTFFGPGDQLHFGRMADRVCAGKGIVVGSGRNALPFVYVTDVVQGLLCALDPHRPVGQAYNISNDRPLSQEEFLQAIAEELGVDPPRLHVPYPALYAAGAAAEYAGRVMRTTRQPVLTRLGVQLFGTDNRHAIDKARRELGYSPQVDLREGVRLSAAWYLQREWIEQAASRSTGRTLPAGVSRRS